jgi:hypothetical protein
MKKEEEKKVSRVVENLSKIQRDRCMTKVAFSEMIGFPEAKWNKIANGIQGLDVCELSKIAERLRMREIDIYTYPKKYIEPQELGIDENDNYKVILQIEVKKEKKEKLVQSILGDNYLELLNGN